MADLNTTTLEVAQDQLITLISMEGERIVVSKTHIQASELLKTLVDGNPSEIEIPLNHIRHPTLDRVIRYLKHHDASNPPKQIEKPLRSAILSEIVDQWDSDLVELTIDQLFELLMAASYLHVKSLVELVSAKIASSFKNKTADQLRKSLNIVKDLTNEEEEGIKTDHRLIEDA